MDLSNSTPNLLGYTRLLLGDPSTAPSQLWSDEDLTDFINMSYLEIFNKLKEGKPGFGVKATVQGTTTNENYSFPTDFERMWELEIEYDGVDIDTDDANPDRLKYTTIQNLQRHKRAGTTNILFWAPRDDEFIIYPTVDTGNTGASSMRITYEYTPVLLVNPTDSPIFPSSHHEVIATLAAAKARTSKDLSNRGLLGDFSFQFGELLDTLKRRDVGDTAQFRNAAFDSVYRKASNMGQIS